MKESDRRAYWSANLRLMAVLLAIWAFVSLGCSVLFVDALNNFRPFDVPFGFWMGQQGSIITFVILIGVYVVRMERLDKEFGIDEEAELRARQAEAGAAS